MEQMLMGAIAAGWLAAGLFFFRFWRQTRDRFFLWFALSFWLEAADRLALGLMAPAAEDSPAIYSLRIVAYGLILLAIWQKNRPRPPR
ncbi:DUF5985 family protein [Ramlibacter alkalitolerans]|jgi:hypothetical protein|uniref:Uncharacterized protein n=1 Tax=Ramlibacter alkalitolerans TaxID=2039631 RepID=A0ABS1JVT3_9BURK|nr:DUF5985 family protein [Ramlibacter alkalitolerans]MBL0428394.1 hypothetical protein [Ramlibacter alkalitolerans]